MDEEDRLFIKVVGEKAARLLKTKNIKLWSVFKNACDENNEKPERVLGSILLKFAKSVVDKDGSFAEDLLGRNIRLTAITKREELTKKVDEIIGLRKKILESDTSSSIEKLIEQLVMRELSSASSPIPIPSLQPQQQQQNISVVIDDKLLSSLSDSELDSLEEIIQKVRETRRISSMIREAEEKKAEEVVDNAEEAEVESEGANQSG